MQTARYLRISQDREGKRLGVDRQREHCQALEARIGATSVIEFCDNDRSASTLSTKKRPDFEKMIAMAERGELDVIVSYSTSRLTRRPMEIERIIPLGERYGVRIHTVKHGDYDLNSARGRRRAREDAARDAEEVEEAAERIRDEVLQRAQQGRFHGGPNPYGLDRTTIREEEARRIRQWAEQVLAGAKPSGIAYRLNQEGVPSPTGSKWRSFVIERILCNPRMAGLRELHGTLYPAPNPPILEEDTWRAVVRKLRPPDKVKRPGSANARKHLGVGLFVCERCDKTVNSAYNTKAVLLYKCLRCSRTWNAGKLNAWVNDVVAERLRRADVATLLAKPDAPDTTALRLEAQGVRDRLTALAEDFADGELTGEQLRVATKRLRRRLEELDSALADAGRLGPLAPLMNAPDPGQAWYDLKDFDRRRAVIAALMTVVLGTPIRGRAEWSPRKFLGASRWAGDPLTWGDHWAKDDGIDAEEL